MNQVLTHPFINLSAIELNYFPFMIGLDKRNGNFNVIDDISTKMKIF